MATTTEATFNLTDATDVVLTLTRTWAAEWNDEVDSSGPSRWRKRARE